MTPCERYEAAVQAVLDGEQPRTALTDPHAAACSACRQTAALAAVLLAPRPKVAPPAGFAERVLPAVVADRRRVHVRRTLQIAVASLAAAVVVAVLATDGRQPPPSATATREAAAPPSEPAPAALPSVDRSIAEARSALVSLTKRATEESLSPARNLFASLDVPQPAAVPTSPPRPAAASPVEPITNTAKRAIHLFIRDVGGLAPKS